MPSDGTKAPTRASATWVVRAILALTISGGFLAFQNCSGPMEVSDSDKVSSTAEKAGFAYDANFDQVAYMSCTEMPSNTYDRQTFFTFRVGAYGEGTGLKLTDEFHSLTKRMKSYEKAQVLSSSPVNRETQIVAALRPANDLQNMFQNSSGGTAKAGEDFMGMLDILGMDTMSEALLALSPGERLRYVRNGYIGGARMEASLYFNRSWEMSAQVRTFLQSQGGVLAVSYSDGVKTSSTGSRAPAHFALSTEPDNTTVFGRGLALTFAQPTLTNLNGAFPQHVLGTVREVNLLSRADTTDSGSWICPRDLQLRIVRPLTTDLQTANCRELPDPTTLDSRLQIVRRTLKAEDWFVDLQNGCAVPKKYIAQNCYGQVDTVAYNVSQACGFDTSPACLHFISICYREN